VNVACLWLLHAGFTTGSLEFIGSLDELIAGLDVKGEGRGGQFLSVMREERDAGEESRTGGTAGGS
jgi:hypothetical protein